MAKTQKFSITRRLVISLIIITVSALQATAQTSSNTIAPQAKNDGIFAVQYSDTEQSRAIGGRIGYGVDFSYQHKMGTQNMINLEVGVPGFNGVNAAVTYDWIFPITSWQKKGTWNWFAGVGGGTGFYWGNNKNRTAYVNIGAAGRIGVEYNFWFPLQLSIDWRPVIGPSFGYRYDRQEHIPTITFQYQTLYTGIALGARYIF